MRPFLLITPYFAPQASVAAYRWVKLARHLPRLGFRPVVLAATFPEDTRDVGLLRALPTEVEVFEEYIDPTILTIREEARNISRRRSAKQQPPARPIEGLVPFKSLLDRCAAHAVHASRSAARIARSVGAEAVLVSAGPFSAVPVGIHVKRALGLPLVLDFRDPWGLHESGRGDLEHTSERVRRALVRQVERRFLAEASHIILNTRRALAAYINQYPEIEGKASFIRNHFDMGLYADPGPRPPSEEPPARFTILHIGTLRVETTIDDIAAAMRALIEREGVHPSEIVLRQIGRITDHERRQVEELGISASFEALPAVPQRDVLREIRRAHVLLSMVHPRVDLRIAAKTYDYVASGMPIISITSNPEVDELLAGRSDNTRVLPGDIAGLTEALSKRIALWRRDKSLPEPAPPLRELSSEAAAEKVAAILEGVLRK